MARTAQYSSSTPATRQLIEAVVQDLVTTQAGSGSRDVGTDVAQPSSAAASSNGQDQQRFFGAIAGSLISAVVPKIATGILGMLQNRRRELGMPEQRDAASVERDLQSILGVLGPKLLESIPLIAAALSGKPAPRGAEEENQRFLPILAAVLPAVISAVPGIISSFNRQRGADATPPSISDPDVAERFLGPLMQTLVPQLVQAAPSILGSIFGGGRDVSAPAQRTW